AVAGAQVVVEARNRIADDLLALGQEEHEVGKNAGERVWREIGLGRRPAPDVIAGIDRLYVRGDLRAHAGADAVGAEEQVGALHEALGKMHANLVAVLLDMRESVAEVVVRRIDGLAQEPLQPVPGGEDLPQRALADDPTVAVDGDALLDLDAEIARAGPA